MRSVGLAAAAGYAALAGLVASGAATGLDQWACSHAMPLAGAPAPPPTLADSVVPLLHAAWQPAGAAVANVVTLPGQALLSFVLVLLAAWKLARSGRAEAALAWTEAFVLAVAVELLCRHVLTRPPLRLEGVHAVAFDSSWPSGHALRASLAVAVLALAWPRLRALLALWLVAVVVMLELAASHTPTDLLGGLLLATLAATGAVALERSGLLRRRPALRRASAGP